MRQRDIGSTIHDSKEMAHLADTALYNWGAGYRNLAREQTRDVLELARRVVARLEKATP